MRKTLSCLLALFILLSQQIAPAHAYRHIAFSTSGNGIAAHAPGDEASALHQCALCVAGAQMASAVPSRAAWFHSVPPARTFDSSVATPRPATRPELAFRSRAPPVL